MKNQCCGTCAWVRRKGEGGLTPTAGICGSLEDAGFRDHVVLMDDPMMGSKCSAYIPIERKATNERPDSGVSSW